MSGGEKQIQKGENGKKCAEVGDLLAAQGHGDIQAWADAKGHVCNCDPDKTLGPVTTKGQVDMTAQNIVDPALHWLQH